MERPFPSCSRPDGLRDLAQYPPGKKRAPRLFALVLAICVGLMPARAHVLTLTRVSLTLTPRREIEIQIDVDLSLLIGDSQGYRDLLLQPASTRNPRLQQLGTQILAEIGVHIDTQG